MRPSSRASRYFELMVVCAIIIILAAVMLPAVVSSIQTANETSVANIMRQVAQAETSYSQLFPTLGYTQTAKYLGGPPNPSGCPNIPMQDGTQSCLLPDAQAAQLDAGSLAGYQFNFSPGTQIGTRTNGFKLQATPSTSLSGRKAFAVDQSGVIYYQTGVAVGTQIDPASCYTPGSPGGCTVLGQ